MRPALARVARRIPDLRLRVVCSEFPRWPEVVIEPVRCRSELEMGALATADVGIMPFGDDRWSRGKCAFKLLQYMAPSLPTVVSPVGANRAVVADGETGFHACDTESWEAALVRLLESAELRRRMGAAGWARAEAHYSMRAFRKSCEQRLRGLIRGDG